MATRTRPRQPAKKRKPPARRPAAKKKQPGLTARSVDVLAKALRSHAGDLAGLSLLVVGVLSAMGVYAGAAGPVGQALHDAYREALGDGRYIVPVALCAIGVLMIWGKAPEVPTAVTVGFVLEIAAACGILGLVGTGGFVGDAISGPLQSALATPGAAVVLIAAAAFGLLLITRTPMRAVPGLIVRAWRWFAPDQVEEPVEDEPEAVADTEPYAEPEPEPDRNPSPSRSTSPSTSSPRVSSSPSSWDRRPNPARGSSQR